MVIVLVIIFDSWAKTTVVLSVSQEVCPKKSTLILNATFDPTVI